MTELPGGVAADQVRQLVRSGASRNLSSSILRRLRLWLSLRLPVDTGRFIQNLRRYVGDGVQFKKGPARVHHE